MPRHRIDLNADLGESFGIYTLGDDPSLMPYLTSANVAAGFHAGDPRVIRATIRLARSHGVAVGVHPSFPDLAGFGRRVMDMPDGDVEDSVLYQIASVGGIARAEGVPIRHVKPHGALYSVAALHAHVAEAIVRAVVAYDRTLVIVAPPGSELATRSQQAGLAVAREGFADRAYSADGQLVPRDRPGALLLDHDRAAEQAVSLAVDGSVMSIAGVRVPLEVDTVCLHGDAPGATERAARVRRALEEAGVEVTARALWDAV